MDKCACDHYLGKKVSGFEPSQKPPEWTELANQYYRSQFHSDYGTISYHCEICQSHIVVEYLEREEDFVHSVQSITRPEVKKSAQKKPSQKNKK